MAGSNKPDRREAVDSSIDVQRGTESLLLGDIKKDQKIRAYLDSLDFMKDFPDDCRVTKAVSDAIKLLAYGKAGADSEKESRLVREYFEGKKKEYDRTHGTESSKSTAEQQRLKEGVSYDREYVKEIPGMGRYLFLVPKDFDGSVDMYFPGDTYSIEMANSTMGLTRHARGKKSALIIVEGDRSCFRDNQKNRYAKFNLPTLLGHFNGQTGLSCTSFNFMGHSRGGSALGDLLDRFKNKPEGVTFTFLDANYWQRDIPKIIEFVRNGGRLNVAFQSNSDYGPGNKEHHTKIARIVTGELIPRLQSVPGLNLRRVGDRWESVDGRVVIQNAGALTHSGVPQRYVGAYMQRDSRGLGDAGSSDVVRPTYASAGDMPPGRPPESADAPREQTAPETAEPYGEEYLKEFTDQVEAARNNAEKSSEFSTWASQQTDAEVLRRAKLSLEQNANDPYAKHVLLASEYIASGTRVNGHAGFSVDFKGNETAEWEIGAGHILPPTVRAVRIYDESGNVLFDYAERKVVGGRVGYYTQNGEYAYIHTGYQIEVLGVKDKKDAEVQASVKEENEVFEAEAKKIAVKKYLKKFFKSKESGVQAESGDSGFSFDLLEVDSSYFEANLGGFAASMDAKNGEWFNKHASLGDAAEATLMPQFTEIFDTAFPKEDFNFIANVLRLRSKFSKVDKLFLSKVLEFKNADVFKVGENDSPEIKAIKAKFKDAMLTQAELDLFISTSEEEGGLGGASLDDAILSGKEVLSDEEFVKDTDDFGDFGQPVVLRVSAMMAFRGAKAIAGIKNVKLKVSKSHSIDSSEDSYQTGGALYLTAITEAGEVDDQILKEVMLGAGFASGGGDPKHWEIYTDRWRRISRKTGSQVYTKSVVEQSADKVSDYEKYVEDEVAETMKRDNPDLVGAEITGNSESPEVDGALARLYNEAYLEVRQRHSERCVPGGCQHVAGYLAEAARRMLGMKTEKGDEGWYIGTSSLNTVPDATARFRGRAVPSIPMSEWKQYLKPGYVVFFAKEGPYERNSGRDVQRGTSDKLSVKQESGQHWATWTGTHWVDNNSKMTNGVYQTNMASLMRTRVVINVVDPLDRDSKNSGRSGKKVVVDKSSGSPRLVKA